MPTSAPDREDPPRLTDDSSPSLPEWASDSKVHDLSELWCDLGGS
ncbi:MAG TPA: hypothetical protein VH092_10840 [Urbifossiella sp.]|jgi:hypothetical protein|nr:hypothetical protein [Urbifossiella sp.]